MIAKHQGIEMKMHRLGISEDQLATHIGKEEATQFSCQTSLRVLEEKEPVRPENNTRKDAPGE